MSFFSYKERLLLHLFIAGSALILFSQIRITIPDLHFFHDGGVKWQQLESLSGTGNLTGSCRYTGRPFDPGFRFFDKTVGTVRNGRCLYFFSRIIAILFLPAYRLGGVVGIQIFQHLLSVLILYLMVNLAGRLDLTFPSTLAALIFFRFATSNLLVLNNLEEHTASTALFLAACTLAIGARRPLHLFVSGILIGGCFSLRPEMGLTVILFPVAVGTLRAKAHPTAITAPDRVASSQNRADSSPGSAASSPDSVTLTGANPVHPFAGALFALNKPNILATATGALPLIVIGLLFNFQTAGHPLGVKIFDPVHQTSPGDRVLNLFFYLIYDPLLITNALLFHMPLLLFLLFYPLRNRFNHLFRRKVLADEKPVTDIAKSHAGAEKSDIVALFNNPARFFLILCAIIPVIVFISPGNFGAPYPGFRFGAFLYPLLILLVFRIREKAIRRVKSVAFVLFVLAYLHSLILTVLLAVVGRTVYSDYAEVYRHLRDHQGTAMVFRDRMALASISDLYFKQPVFLARSTVDVREALRRLKKEGVRKAVVVSHRLARLPPLPDRAAFPPGTSIRRERGRLSEILVLEFPR